MDASVSAPTSVLPRSRRFAYGVGHVLNDLCASMWFTYLLLYLHNVVQFNNVLAGNLMLLGQVVDALATPFVGLESDRMSGFCHYGKRKSWHLLGPMLSAGCGRPANIRVANGLHFTGLVLMSLGTFAALSCIVLMYSACRSAVGHLLHGGLRNKTTTIGINCTYHVDDWAKFVYYAPFIALFQFGWAATQISHLALIPDLTPVQSERVELNTIRYAFTVMSNLVVFGLAWTLLGSLHSSETVSGLSPKDSTAFMTLVLIVVGIGLVFSLIFHFGTKEKATGLVRVCENGLKSSDQPHESSSTAPVVQYTWRCWMKQPQFYVNGLLYMCTRLTVNMTQVYLGMYLLDTLNLHKTYIAIIPLITYVSGFISTLPMKPLNKLLGGRASYFIGVSFTVGSCSWFYFLHESSAGLTYMLMAAAVLSGIGGAFLLVNSLQLTADLIGENTKSGAFVYGAMSFADKLSNGIAIQIIQLLHPCKTEACCSLCGPYYRIIFVFVPGAAVLFGLLLLFFIRKKPPVPSPAINNSDEAECSERKPLLDARPPHP